MDTVVPGENVHPVVDGDVIRTDGTTVLGGDDKSGIVAILESVRALRDHRIPDGPIEILFTVCEAGDRVTKYGEANWPSTAGVAGMTMVRPLC